MFMTLGQIVFSTLTSPESLEAERSYEYPEHNIVEGKPVLQWVGDGLETLTFNIMLHANFTNPATALQDLRQAASDHKALPLIYGNGYHRGKFVITKISVSYKLMSDLGDLIIVTADISLKEFVPDLSIPPTFPPFIPSAVGGQPNLTRDPSAGGGQGQIQLPVQQGLSPLLVMSAEPTTFNLFSDVPPSTAVRSE